MGRSRGGLTTKVHALVDARGLPIRMVLTAGHVHDSQAVPALLGDLSPHSVVLADKGYDADWIRSMIEARGCAPNIPAKSNRTQRFCFSKTLYREHNRIERFFLQDEAVPPSGDPLREARGQLPGHAQACCHPTMVEG